MYLSFFDIIINIIITFIIIIIIIIVPIYHHHRRHDRLHHLNYISSSSFVSHQQSQSITHQHWTAPMSFYIDKAFNGKDEELSVRHASRWVFRWFSRLFTYYVWLRRQFRPIFPLRCLNLYYISLNLYYISLNLYYISLNLYYISLNLYYISLNIYYISLNIYYISLNVYYISLNVYYLC